MFIDASAIVAILVREADGPRADATARPGKASICRAVKPLRAVLGVARARDVSLQEARAAGDHFVAQTSAEIVPLLRKGDDFRRTDITLA